MLLVLYFGHGISHPVELYSVIQNPIINDVYRGPQARRLIKQMVHRYIIPEEKMRMLPTHAAIQLSSADHKASVNACYDIFCRNMCRRCVQDKPWVLGEKVLYMLQFDSMGLPYIVSVIFHGHMALFLPL